MLHQSQWQRSIKQIATHAGEDVRKEEHLLLMGVLICVTMKISVVVPEEAAN